MNARQLVIAIAVLALVAAMSGCICCCGLDGMLSKLKKPVSSISFPSQINIGGKVLSKIYSNEYLDPDSVKSGLKNFAAKLGYQAGGDLSDTVNTLIDATGIKQYKSFKYSDGTDKGTMGGLVGKADSPVQVAAGYEATKAAVNAALPTVNDPGQNTGDIQSVAASGGSDLGDGGDRYVMKVDGQDCYFVVAKYSNTYIMAYSFESFSAAEAGIQMAIEQIDAAASS
jgi:hypothetical protein